MIHHNSRFLTELDILLAGLILVAMLSVGKAVVSYEVFTGGSLPRRGLLRHWMFALWVGIFFSLIGAFLLVYPEGILEGVLAAALLVAAGLVLAMQESLKERERTIHQLRPLLDVDPLLSSIISPLETKPAGLDLQTTFANLCRETWQTRQAMLVPLGQLATLGVSPLIYAGEGDRNIQMPPLPGLDEISHSTTGIPLQGEAGCGFIWMVPLRNERGLIGVCYLGEKNDGGFYSKEEIELVGDSAERIADWMFVAELARRLVILQRQRMVENQVLDRRTRLVLHDEVLPRLHTILLRAGSLSETETSQAKEIVDELSRLHRQISGLLRELPPSAPPDLQSRGLCAAIRNLVEVELASEFDQVFVEIDPEADQNSRLMPALVIEVFYYAAREVVRNAARHGRGQRERNLVLNLSAKWNSGLELVIEDNGEGLDSTKAGSTGSGQGLALHATLMAVIGGSLALASEAGKYTRAILFISREELN